MKRVVLVVLIAAAALLSATAEPPDAEACFNKQPCSGSISCAVLVSTLDPGSWCDPWPSGAHPGGYFVTPYGQRCNYIDANGATTCNMYGRLEWWPAADVPGATCQVVSHASLQDLGCCQTPCPPSFPDCHAN